MAILLALMLLLALLPAHGLAGCLHSCPRENRYGSWGQVSSYNETQHRSYRTVYEYCSACGGLMRTYKQYNYDDHSYNSNGRCTKCGYEKPCEHKHSTLTSDNRVTQPLNSTQHATSGSAQYYCNDCHKNYSVEAKENKENHDFSGGTCAACGYTMVLLATPCPTENACAHEDTKQTVASSQIAPKNESYHNINELMQDKCRDCGEVVRTYENTRQEAHSIKDGVCTACGMQFACQHKNETTETVIIAATPNRDNTHTVQRMCTRTCTDCSVILGTELTPVTQPHTFIMGYCALCNAEAGAKWRLEVDVTEVEVFVLEETTLLASDQFGLFADRPFTGRSGGFSDAPTAEEGEEADFGVLIAALDHPYGFQERYAMRVGDEATLFAMLLEKQAEEEEEPVDEVSSATGDMEDGVDTEEEAEEALDLFTDEDIVNVLAENFGWETDGGITLEGSTLTATQEGSGEVLLTEAEGFTIYNGDVIITVYPADDPYLWFVDQDFVQGNLPLLAHEPLSNLAVSFENLGYDPELKTLRGAYVSRLPFSVGALFYYRGEANATYDTSISAPLTTEGIITHFGEALTPIAASSRNIYAYPDDAPGYRSGFMLPLEGFEYFEITMPWQSVLALGTNFANLLATSFLATPEASAALKAMEEGALPLDTVLLGKVIADGMMNSYTIPELSAEDSPARALYAQIARGDAAQPLLQAAETDPASRGMAMAFAAGSAADQFRLVDEGLRDAFGIDAVALMQQFVAPELIAPLMAVRSLPTGGNARDWAELEAVSTCVELARLVDETWGQEPLVRAFVSLEIDE
jgi:hypothetical protein